MASLSSTQVDDDDTTPWSHPWPKEVHFLSPHYNFSNPMFTDDIFDAIILYMNFSSLDALYNQSLGGEYWFAVYTLDRDKAEHYRIKHYGLDGYLFICMPIIWNHPVLNYNGFECYNYTGESWQDNRHDFTWWYNYQRPAVDIMISVSALVTLAGVFGKLEIFNI